MNIERIVYLKRSLKYGIKKNNNKEIIDLLNELIKQYYENLEVCSHGIYLDNGYYRFRNNEIYKTDKEHAEIRSLTCPICHKETILLNTDEPNWDNEIMGKQIKIITPLKLNHKQASLNLLMPYINKLMNENDNLSQEYCGHLEFVNNGYYTYNGQLQRSTRGRAQFRIVTCTCCDKSYFIPKVNNDYWDVTIDENPISVYDADDEKSKQYVITM